MFTFVHVSVRQSLDKGRKKRRYRQHSKGRVEVPAKYILSDPDTCKLGTNLAASVSRPQPIVDGPRAPPYASTPRVSGCWPVCICHHKPVSLHLRAYSFASPDNFEG